MKHESKKGLRLIKISESDNVVCEMLSISLNRLSQRSGIMIYRLIVFKALLRFQEIECEV